MHSRQLYSLVLTCLCLTGCTSLSTPEPATVTEAPPATEAFSATNPIATPVQELGSEENPLILALPPSSTVDGVQVEGGKAFAEQLSEVTGYSVVVVAPESNARLIEAMEKGNAHIAMLTPYAYVFAYQQGIAEAAFASVRSGEKTYGAQFIARVDEGYSPFYDAFSEQNIVEASVALAKFNEKKPCWSDENSASSYVVPLGVLRQNDIQLRPAAFVEGQPTVVRAVYAGGICDFGATYVDARQFPVVLDEYPDVLEKVIIVWRIPAIIPYENLSIARSLPPEIALAVKDAIFRISGMQAGREVMGQAYGIAEWERVSDAFYEDFRIYVEASGVDTELLMKNE